LLVFTVAIIGSFQTKRPIISQSDPIA